MSNGINTIIKKSKFNGWEAESTLTLWENEDGTSMQLSLCTRKHSSGGFVYTHASVAKIKPQAGGYSTKTYALYEDYHQGFNKQIVSRVTDKAIEKAHKMALEQFEEVKQAALAHYGR